jgi:hypothetical protein
MYFFNTKNKMVFFLLKKKSEKKTVKKNRVFKCSRLVVIAKKCHCIYCYLKLDINEVFCTAFEHPALQGKTYFVILTEDTKWLLRPFIHPKIPIFA